uniref:UPF3 domain-containing protein n=1 Tax=Romanomermis culicivorax TaxID=13658 RepID=A0A915JW01_ROMCU
MGENSEEKSKENDESRKTGKKFVSTKVVVRRLPPSLTEKDFLDQIAPPPAYDYFYFVPADMSLSPWSYTRAYISIPCIEDVIQFTERFDGYVFVDAKGSEYPAVIELAPNQKIPTKKVKKDAKCGTIDQDPDFKKFVDELKNPKQSEIQPLSSVLAEIEKKEKELKENKGVLKLKTPLLDFLEWRKEERRKHGEEKRRQKEEERIRREEEYARRIEKEKADAAKKKREMENQKQRERIEERHDDPNHHGRVKLSKKDKSEFPKRSKAPRFVKKAQSSYNQQQRTSSESQAEETCAIDLEEEKTKIVSHKSPKAGPMAPKLQQPIKESAKERNDDKSQPEKKGENNESTEKIEPTAGASKERSKTRYKVSLKKVGSTERQEHRM